jgi:hypothetical protein
MGSTRLSGLTKTITELVKKGATLELQERITELRETVLDAKDEVLKLREENQSLRGELQDQETWDTRAAAYRVVKTNGGAIVMYSSVSPAHFACPTCFGAKTIQFLQDSNKLDGTFYCPGECGKSYPLRPRGAAGTKQDVQIVDNTD